MSHSPSTDSTMHFCFGTDEEYVQREKMASLEIAMRLRYIRALNALYPHDREGLLDAEDAAELRALHELASEQGYSDVVTSIEKVLGS